MQASLATPPNGVNVVIAANDIPVGAKIEDRDVKIIKFPPEDVPHNVFRSKTHVVGRGVVVPIAKGEFILPSRLAALIPPGMQAVSVRISGVLGGLELLVPGTCVDVLVRGNLSQSSETQTTSFGGVLHFFELGHGVFSLIKNSPLHVSD